jgi:hypothetical protein
MHARRSASVGITAVRHIPEQRRPACRQLQRALGLDSPLSSARNMAVNRSSRSAASSAVTLSHDWSSSVRRRWSNTALEPTGEALRPVFDALVAWERALPVNGLI